MPYAEPATEPARLRLMGRFRLATAAGETIQISSRRARGLLAYLALAPEQAASRERLAGLLWSDRGEAQARASLRQCLLDLKTILTEHDLDMIEAGREQVSLRSETFLSDVAQLEDALRKDAVDVIVSALGAVESARLLEDLEIGGLYRDWLDQIRERLEQSIAAGVIGQIQRLEAQGGWSKVRALAEGFLRRDPLDEAVVAAAIRADAALGNTTAAHRRFQILQSALAREFGATPGAAAREALARADQKTEGERPPTPTMPAAQSDAAIPPLVIVAAFETSDPDSAQTRLSATLRDEVLSGLSRFHDLRVITDPRSLDELATDAGTERAGAYTLGANLRSGAGGHRLIVQLTRSGERHVVWSERFTLPHLEIVDAIDDIIAQVVGAVLPTINDDLVRRPSHLPTDQLHTRYLKARDDAFEAVTFEAARAAADELESLVAAQPDFVLPYLPLARLYNTDFGYTLAGASGHAEQDRAFALARNALALDRGHVHGYTVAGWCHLRRRQWAAASTHFEQALRLNPFHADRLKEAGFGFIFLGELDRARTLLDRCLLLNPTPDDEFFNALGLLEMVRGDHDRAASYFDLIAEPTIWGRTYDAMNAQKGGFPARFKADRAVERIAAIWPEERVFDLEAIIAWIASHHPFSQAALEADFLTSARQALEPALGSPEPAI